MLDEKNKIIFECLLANARISIKDLAKILKITKAAVFKRITFLEQMGFISRYDAIINWQKLPFIKKVYFLKSSKNEKLEKKIKLNTCVFSLFELSGEYQYQVWCFFKTKEEETLFEKQINTFSYLDINIEELIFPKVTFFDVSIDLPTPKNKENYCKMKRVDVEIMKYMAQGHGRESLYKMSLDLKKPYDMVHYHAKKLISGNYFLKIVAQPGIDKFGLETTVLLLKLKDKKSATEIYSRLNNTKKILSVAICKDNAILIHFLSQNLFEYKETLSNVFSLNPEKVACLINEQWKTILLNNRYPLDYLLKS